MKKIFFILFITCITFISKAQEIESMIRVFEQRANPTTLKPDTAKVTYLLQQLSKSLIANPSNYELLYYYLATRNFKARFIITDINLKRKYLKENIVLAKQCMQLFPKSGPVIFETITAIGLEAEVNGIIKNAYNGVVDQMNQLALKLYYCDSMYYCCGAWKIISVLNYSVPKIPGIISWPDKSYALKLMQKAIAYFPNDTGANFYYAEALWNSGNKTLAKGFFKRCMEVPARKFYLLEDYYFKYKAKEYLYK